WRRTRSMGRRVAGLRAGARSCSGEGGAMSEESSHTPLDRMSRRQMLGTTALLGGLVAGVGGEAAAALAGDPAVAQAHNKSALAPGDGPNLAPRLVQVAGGKLRGLREGKTLSFLGVRYAEAERFGLPKPVQSWDGTKNAQVWGPVCP